MKDLFDSTLVEDTKQRIMQLRPDSQRQWAQAIPVPDQFTTARALMFQSLTAQYLVTEYRDVRPGDRVLVHLRSGRRRAAARAMVAVSIGSASGRPPAIPPEQLISQCTRLAAGSVFSYTAESDELQRRAGAVIEGIRAGWLRVDEGTAYPLERAAEAHRDIEGRGTQGKLYLTP